MDDRLRDLVDRTRRLEVTIRVFLVVVVIGVGANCVSKLLVLKKHDAIWAEMLPGGLLDLPAQTTLLRENIVPATATIALLMVVGTVAGCLAPRAIGSMGWATVIFLLAACHILIDKATRSPFQTIIQGMSGQ